MGPGAWLPTTSSRRAATSASSATASLSPSLTSSSTSCSPTSTSSSLSSTRSSTSLRWSWTSSPVRPLGVLNLRSIAPALTRCVLKPTVSLLEALANPSKDRLKEDGTNVSTWLQCTAPDRACADRAMRRSLFCRVTHRRLRLRRPDDVHGRPVPALPGRGRADAAARVHCQPAQERQRHRPDSAQGADRQAGRRRVQREPERGAPRGACRRLDAQV